MSILPLGNAQQTVSELLKQRSHNQSVNWSQAQLNRQHTAGEVVARRIREDGERIARLADQSNGHVKSETTEVEKVLISENTTDKSNELVEVNNSSSLESELPVIEENPQEEENYEYSQTTDS